MYRRSVELSVQYDGQSQSESGHASLIDEHARLILFLVFTSHVIKTNTRNQSMKKFNNLGYDR